MTQTPATLERAAALKRVRKLSRLLDSSIKLPLVNYRVGLDAVIGLVPFVGDALGMLLSSYIILEAARMGAAKSVLARMAFNVALEGVVGAIPLVGDIFDAMYKANLRNVRLLEQSLQRIG